VAFSALFLFSSSYLAGQEDEELEIRQAVQERRLLALALLLALLLLWRGVGGYRAEQGFLKGRQGRLRPRSCTSIRGRKPARDTNTRTHTRTRPRRRRKIRKTVRAVHGDWNAERERERKRQSGRPRYMQNARASLKIIAIWKTRNGGAGDCDDHKPRLEPNRKPPVCERLAPGVARAAWRLSCGAPRRKPTKT